MGRRLLVLALVTAGAASVAVALSTAAPRVVGKQEQIYLVAATGGKVTQLTPANRSALAPSWSPSGKRIAFVQGGHVTIVDRDGRSHRIVLGGPSGFDPPSWSPDGKQIAFTRLKSPEGPASIVVASADGSTARVIDATPWGTGDAARGPVWSPDGKRLAYCLQGPETSEQGGVRASGELNLAVARVDGGGKSTVTTAPGSEFGPAWSPDSKTILYDGEPLNKPGANGAGLRLVRSSGGPSKTVIRLAEGGADAAWSPNGRLIAFVGWLPGEQRARLYVVRPDGGGLRRLTGEVPPQTPAWSPGGATIAYATSSGTIETIRPDGTGHTKVVSLPGSEIRSLAWSPDGKTIAFDARETPPES